MCSFKDEPWRRAFTGPPCICGIPTAGTDEERQIQKAADELASQKRREKWSAKLNHERERRLNELAQKYG